MRKRRAMTGAGLKSRAALATRVLPRVALVAALLLAGCAAPGGAEERAPAAPGAGASPFLPAVDLGPGGPEPVIAFDPEGERLYVAAQDPLGGGPRVWVSTDAGRTFALKRPTTEGGGEVDLAAGPGGLVVLTQLGARGNVVSVSTDGGESWRTSPLGAQTQYFDREWLAIDAQGRVYVVARDFGQLGQRPSAGVSRSDDRGATFAPLGKAWTFADEPGDANGNLVAAGGAVHLPYVCRGGQGVCVATSRDGGVSWSQRLVVERDVSVSNVYPALAATSAGLLLAWSDASEGALAVFAASSRDGASWSAPQRVSPAGATATLPWVAARGSTAWVAWLGADAALAATDCADAAGVAWAPRAQRVDLGGAPQGAPLETGLVVHRGPISPPVGQTCSGAARDRSFGDFFTAAVGPDGKLVLAASVDEGTPESTRDAVLRER